MTISAGRSDFHKIIVTVLKMEFPPKIIYYRCNKNLIRTYLGLKLREKLEINKSSNYSDLEYIFKHFRGTSPLIYEGKSCTI